jgi:hypothetical protein
MKRALAVLALCLTATALKAQDATPPEPILSVTINPQRIVVGQSAVLQIDVLAPNYMTKPPVLPDFQISNAVTRAGSTLNMSDQRNGVSYAGVRFEFMIHPQEAGSYAIAGKSVTITYAADPPNTREAELSIPRITFEAFVPDAAEALDPFFSATKLAIRQDIQPSSQPLKVGDSVTRTVTIDAEGAPSMLLPVTAFAAIDGTKIYSAQPELEDKLDRRSDALSSTRTDRATYMLLRAGDLTLPAVEVRWWNAREQKVEQARIEPVALQISDNPSLTSSAVPTNNPVSYIRRAALLLIDHWRATLALLIATGALAWLGPRATRTAYAWIMERRNAYRASEACAFVDVRTAARRGDPTATYFALLRWLERFEPAAPSHTIGALKAVAHDAALDREIAMIEQRLYGAQRGDADWSGRPLMKQLAAVRHKLLRRESRREAALPAEINPRTLGRPTAWRWRPVAR